MARLEGKRSRAIEGDSHALEVKFEIAFQTAGIPMSSATIHEGRLLEVNDAYCKVSGYERSDDLGGNSACLVENHVAIVGSKDDLAGGCHPGEVTAALAKVPSQDPARCGHREVASG